MKTALLLSCALLGSAAQAAPIASQGSWTQTLQARNLAGQAVALGSAQAVFFYDRLLDVTWLRQVGAGERLSWSGAQRWAADLVVGAWDDWRLPQTVDSGLPGCAWVTYNGGDCGYNVLLQQGGAYSELVHLYHHTLGNLSAYTTQGQFRGWPGQGRSWGLANTGPFDGLRSDWGYWSGSSVAAAPNFAWWFGLGLGYQAPEAKSQLGHAIALRDGDVLVAGTPVPLPGSLLLSLSALPLLLRRSTARS